MMPFVSLCVLFSNNRETLPALLQSVKGCFDEFVFCDTGSTDGSRVLVEEFLLAECPRASGRVVDFKWIDDFGAARQFNFDQASGRFRFFLDSDDQLVNGENVRKLLTALELKQPAVEALFVPYEYGHLETLHTMRCVRWRAGWQWNDAIHERLEFSYPDGSGLPDEAFNKVDAFHVLHKDKTEEEKHNAIRRNARIAEREYASTSDPKYRARLARTLAMEAKMDGRASAAIPWLEELYGFYRKYPEGRQAAADVAKSYLHLADTDEDAVRILDYFEKALIWARKAGPAYESLVYHGRATYLRRRGLTEEANADYRQCLKATQRSLGRGQQATHEGLIFEQGACYVAAAQAALSLGVDRAADVAENLLNHVPPVLRNDATLIEHVTLIRKEVDRITILVPGTPQPFDENGGGGMLGGSEEAVLYLTRELAKAGRNVRVWGVLPPQRVPGPDQYGIDWQRITDFDKHLDDEHGTLVFWRAPGLLLNLMKLSGQRKSPLAGVTQSYVWLHDAGLGIPPNLAKVVSEGCQGAVILSDFHASVIRRAGWTGNLFKLSNGVVKEDFEPYVNLLGFGIGTAATPGYDRDPNSVVYSSCPSRGLVQLLEMWPTVRAAVPEARLDLYYDWSMLEQMQPQKYDQVRELLESVQHLDVVHHGGVDHETLHAALRRTNVWAYSHFESPEAETFCISAVKALAAGATVLAVPNGALPEVASDGHLVTETGTYCRKLINLLQHPESVTERRKRAERALERYSWDRVARGFGDLWSVRGKELDAVRKAITTSERR